MHTNNNCIALVSIYLSIGHRGGHATNERVKGKGSAKPNRVGCDLPLPEWATELLEGLPLWLVVSFFGDESRRWKVGLCASFHSGE